MSVVALPGRETEWALDGIQLAWRFRVQAEATEAEWLAALAADPDPYRDGRGELGKDWIVEDVACTLRIPSAVAAAKLHVAHQLATRFPATFEALREQRLDLRYATRLVDAAQHLPDPVLPAVEADALDQVDTRTLAGFSARVRRAVANADPRTAEDKHQADRDDRRVAFTPVANGMTELWALLPAEQAAALQSAIQQLADKTAGTADRTAGRTDERTADQRRADALCDLATGGHGLRPHVQVTVPLSTLLDVDNQPGDLTGHGPITAATARALAFDPTGTWRRLLTDPDGGLRDATSRRYRPPAPMKRFVQLRDRTCRFPTCRRRADTCDIDHVIPWPEGPTTPANLIPLCSRHHHLKHDSGWHTERHPDSTITWTSPTGQHWTTPPPDPLGGT